MADPLCVCGHRQSQHVEAPVMCADCAREDRPAAFHRFAAASVSADSDSPPASPPLPKMCGYCHRELPPGRPWFADESFGFTQEHVDFLHAAKPWDQIFSAEEFAMLDTISKIIKALLPSPDPSR